MGYKEDRNNNNINNIVSYSKQACEDGLPSLKMNITTIELSFRPIRPIRPIQILT